MYILIELKLMLPNYGDNYGELFDPTKLQDKETLR